MANEGLPEWFTPETAPEQLMPEQPQDLPDWFTRQEVQPEPQRQPVDPNLGFADRLKAMSEERTGAIEKSLAKYQKGDISYGSLFLQGMGNGVAWLGDMVGETAATILSELTPDEAEEWLKQQVAAGANAIISTDMAQALIKQYQGMDENTRKNIEGTANIMLGAVAPKSVVGKAIKESGVKSDINALGKMLLDQDTKARKARFGEIGMDAGRQYMAKRDRDIMNSLISIDGMSSGLPRKKIMSLLNKENARLGQQVTEAMSNVTGSINKKSLRDIIGRKMDDLGKLDPAFISEDLIPVKEKILRQLDATLKTINDEPNSFAAKDLLRVRRKFDQAIETAFKKNVHEGDDAFRPLVAAVRDHLNDTMERLAPDANIRTLMRRQHHVMLGRDNLMFYNDITKSPMERVMRKVEGHPLLTASALGLTGGAGALASPMVGIGAGLFAGGYAATRPMVRRGAGEALKEVPFGRTMFYGYDEQNPEQQQ